MRWAQPKPTQQMSKREKLNLQQVIEILTEFASEPSRKVAQRYGVCRTTITNIRRGRSWKTQLILLQEVERLPRSVWQVERAPLKKYKKKQDQSQPDLSQIPQIHRPDPFRSTPLRKTEPQTQPNVWIVKDTTQIQLSSPVRWPKYSSLAQINSLKSAL